MRELTRDNMITTTELLLFDILQELKKQYNAIPVPTMTLVTETINKGANLNGKPNTNNKRNCNNSTR